jgi:hypothetical protein
MYMHAGPTALVENWPLRAPMEREHARRDIGSPTLWHRAAMVDVVAVRLASAQPV